MDSTVDCIKEMAKGALVTSSFVNTDEKKDKILHMPWVSETCVPSESINRPIGECDMVLLLKYE